jgi:toxin ParE1/3/4
LRIENEFLNIWQSARPGGARNVAASIRDAVAQLGDQPHSGYRTDNPEVRVTFVVRYPYKIFYRVHDDVVEILHIRHTSRRARD